MDGYAMITSSYGRRLHELVIVITTAVMIWMSTSRVIMYHQWTRETLTPYDQLPLPVRTTDR